MNENLPGEDAQDREGRTARLIQELNSRLEVVRQNISDNRLSNKKAEPGYVFFVEIAPAIENEERLAQFVALREERQGLWLCAKMSIEVEHAGPFDLVLDSDEFTGGYPVMIEAWNVVDLHETDVGHQFHDKIPASLIATALRLFHAHQIDGIVPEDVMELTGPPLDEIDDRWEFQEKEAFAVERIRRHFHEIPAGKPVIIGPRIYVVDPRVAYDIPYDMAVGCNGKLIPARKMAPMTEEYDRFRVKGSDGPLICVVPAATITPAFVEEIESKRIEWSDINRKILHALSQSDHVSRFRDLEQLLHDTDNDFYVAFNLAWLFYFEGKKNNALEHLAQAEKGLRPEFMRIAKKLRDALTGKDPDSEIKDEAVFQVWDVRCHTTDPYERINRLERVYLKMQDGYVAYEIAREFRHTGPVDPSNIDFSNYEKARKWAMRALNARNPVPTDMRRWPEEMVRIIKKPIPELPAESKLKPVFYVPCQEMAA